MRNVDDDLTESSEYFEQVTLRVDQFYHEWKTTLAKKPLETPRATNSHQRKRVKPIVVSHIGLPVRRQSEQHRKTNNRPGLKDQLVPSEFERIFTERLKLQDQTNPSAAVEERKPENIAALLEGEFPFSISIWRRHYRSDHVIWPLKILPALARIILFAMQVSSHSTDLQRFRGFLGFAGEIIQLNARDLARLVPRLWQQLMTISETSPLVSKWLVAASTKDHHPPSHQRVAFYRSNDNDEGGDDDSNNNHNGIGRPTAIPYNDRRDSRSNKVGRRSVEPNTYHGDRRPSNQQHLQATNQQKMRDLFLEYVQSTTPQAQTGFAQESPPFSPNRHGNDTPQEWVQRILGRLRSDNYGWFATFLVDYHESTAERVPTGDCDRLVRLEERLVQQKCSYSSHPPTTHPVRRFLVAADSGRLETRVLEVALSRIIQIHGDLLEGIGCAEGPKAVERMVQLAVLIGGIIEDCGVFSSDSAASTMVSFSLWSHSAWDQCLQGLLKEAIERGALLVTLPWIKHLITLGDHRLMTEPEPESLNLDVPLNLDSNLVATILLYADHHHSKEIQSISFPSPSPPSFALIDGELVAQRHSVTYQRILAILRGAGDVVVSTTTMVAVQQKGTDDSGNSSSNTNSMATTPSNKSPSTATRKIRPTMAGADAGELIDPIQKQLRQWLWWQFPAMYDQIRTLTRYLLSETLAGSDVVVVVVEESAEEVGCRVEEAALRRLSASLRAIIPHLLPPLLAASSEATHRLITALALEMLDAEQRQRSAVM